MKSKDWKTTITGLIIGVVLLLVQYDVISVTLGDFIKAFALMVFGYIASGVGDAVKLNTDWKTTVFGIIGGVAVILAHFGVLIPEDVIQTAVNLIVAVILFVIALLSQGNEYTFDGLKQVKEVDWHPTVVGIIGGIAIVLAALGIIIPSNIVNLLIAITVAVLGYVTTGIKQTFLTKLFKGVNS